MFHVNGCSGFNCRTFYAVEGTVLAIGENTSYGLPIASYTSDQPHIELRVVARQQYSHPKSTKSA